MNTRFGPFQTITVFGAATVDRVAATFAPPVLGASNPGSSKTLVGGVGLNVATSLRRLGHGVRFVGRVGADQDGEAILATARTAGLDTAWIAVSHEARTANYHAAFDDSGGLILGIADMAINDELTPASVAPATRQTPRGNLWVVDANLPAETLDFLVGDAEASRIPVAALGVSPAKAVRLAPLLDRLSLLFVNRREAGALLDITVDDRRPAAGQLALGLARQRVRNFVLSDGAGPLTVFAGEEMRSFAALKARVRSVNGGGDALAAGTIHGLARGQSLFEAVLSGLAAAAIAVESEGTILTELGPEALMARLAGIGAAP